MIDSRLSREEIALRLLCAFIQAGRPIGPDEIRQSFALARTFEEHSDKLGARPWRSRVGKLAHDDDGI